MAVFKAFRRRLLMLSACAVCTRASQISYPMSKRLNTSEFLLDENEHFNYISINVNQSTVHVPTNVYEQCKQSFLGDRL